MRCRRRNFALQVRQVVSVTGILPYRGRVLFDGQDLAGSTLEDCVSAATAR